jgi:pyruvate,water dikinase
VGDWILPLEGIRLPATAVAGRKAAALGELFAAGFPVPPGLCITTGSFKAALAPFQAALEPVLSAGDLSDPSAALAASTRIVALLEGLALPDPLLDALEAACAGAPDLAGRPLAVRSSATLEDLDGMSFAGQYLSRIGVRSREALHAAILDCWRSFYSAPALATRARYTGPQGDAAMALLIQPVVEAECAGVCFTVDPVGRRRDRLVVNATWGLGTGVVDGSAAADIAWVQRWHLETLEQKIVAKHEQDQLNPAGGVERAPVAPEMVQAACLPQNWLKRVAEFSLACEHLFGAPQDVEWAIAEEQVWLLQSRPLTGLPPDLAAPAFPLEWEDPQDRYRLWRPVPGSDGRPMLPIEEDHVEAAEATKQEAARFSGNASMVQVKLFNGRPYFCAIPSGLSPGDQRIRQQMMADLDRRLGSQGLNTWDYWGPEVIAAVERLGAFDLAGAPGPALAEHLEDALGAMRRHWVIHALVWSPAYWPLRQAYTALTGRPDAEAEAEVAWLIQGEESALTRLIDDLYGLAEAARPSPGLVEFVASPPPDPLARLAELQASLPPPEQPAADRLRTRLENLLESYGNRTGKGFGSEMTLLTPTWREDPSRPLRLAAPYLDPAIEPPAATRARARQARDEQVEQLCRAGNDPARVADFRFWLGRARRDAPILEDHNHYIDQVSDGHLRNAAMAAGKWLAGRSDLAEPGEVFWLRVAEICAALRNPALESLNDRIARRKAQHEQRAAMEAPPILGLPDARLDPRPPLESEWAGEETEEEMRITGQGASPGLARGRARLVPAGVELPDLAPGDMLVAENAGPQWTPFFPILGGLVLERGALGQHAAAAAREYGVPAVIGARDATRRIPDGGIIVVDGTQGTIEIIAG